MLRPFFALANSHWVPSIEAFGVVQSAARQKILQAKSESRLSQNMSQCHASIAISINILAYKNESFTVVPE